MRVTFEIVLIINVILFTVFGYFLPELIDVFYPGIPNLDLNFSLRIVYSLLGSIIGITLNVIFGGFLCILLDINKNLSEIKESLLELENKQDYK